jgi:hypothetical protein
MSVTNLLANLYDKKARVKARLSPCERCCDGGVMRYCAFFIPTCYIETDTVASLWLFHFQSIRLLNMFYNSMPILLRIAVRCQ